MSTQPPLSVPAHSPVPGPPGSAIDDLVEWARELFSGPVLRTVALALLVYPVGWAVLWVQFRVAFNTGFATAWYAVSLAPTSTVVVHGLTAIWTPLLCVLAGALLALLIRATLRRPSTGALRGALALLPLATVALLAGALVWFQPWPRGAALGLSVFLGAAAAFGIAGFISRDPRRRFHLLAALVAAYLTTVAAILVDVGFLSALVGGAALAPLERRPLPYAELMLRQPEVDFLGWDDVVCGFPDPRCLGGSLLDHRDDYWYVFAPEEQGGTVFTLRAIPEGDVASVSTFPSREWAVQLCFVRLRPAVPPLYIQKVRTDGEPADPEAPCGATLAPPVPSVLR